MSTQLSAVALDPNATSQQSVAELIDAAEKHSRIGDLAGAQQIYRNWIEANPEHAHRHIALFNLSSLDSQTGNISSAMESLTQAIAADQDFVPAYVNLAGLIDRAGARDKAIELWTAAAAKPATITGVSVAHAVAALKQIARVSSELHQPQAAEAAIQTCLDINPNQRDAVEQLIAQRLVQCKWPIIETIGNLDSKTLIRGLHPLSTCVYTDDPLLQLATADRYVRQSSFEGPIDFATDRRSARIDLRNRRLRVGYVSSDLCDHAIGYLMAEFFELHGKSDIEVFVYNCGPASTSELTLRTKAAVAHWTDINELSDDEAARRIAEDGIDILVDVNGHTRNARTGVFARHAAPVQVNWLGFPGTMGTPCHHYIIADDWIIPQDSEIYFSEKVVRLPCYQPNDRMRVVSGRQTRADVGLPEDGFVYCCFNGTQKISRFTFDRWMEILNRVPDSVLWLLETSAESRKRLCDYAEARGIERERIVFAPKWSNPAHLARYALADLVLDTAPYGAHTTASDALWACVPVLTLSGRSFASRVCGSLVRSAGIGELVVTRSEDYVERAVALANDPAQIAAYKQKLEAGRDRCILFDTNLLVARIEELYRWMAREHNAGRTPTPELANLESYLEAGIEHPHEDIEMLAVADYHGIYKAKLALRHLARPLPPDNRIWSSGDIALAEARTGIGTLAVLHKLATLKAAAANPVALVGIVRSLLPAALRQFNEHLDQGEIAEAEQYVSALLALVPRNTALVNAALSCNLALGRKDEALRHAHALLETEPSHALARELVVQSLSPRRVGLEALVRLRDIHDEISLLLCKPLDVASATLIQILLTEARALQINAEPGSEIEGWETHYSVMLDAVDLGAMLNPTPAPLPDAGVEIVSSSEQPTSWLELRAAAARMGAQAVFFAAADRDYVDLYAKWYIKSILKHCDVPFLVVVHVIGGAANLPDIVRSVGIRDKRVFFAGDDFDTGAVTTACFDAPPKGKTRKPLSHLQSIRFLRLGSLLQKLKLPVFVSDIDLVLQFGVKDLLERCAQDDVVLNCNEQSKHAGSRITANLVLANPTENADRFFAFLRSFLERQLAKPGVTRWVDQTGLLLALHHLSIKGSDPRVGYFDTSRDINNLMFRTYQENPFRFLSLYHGFDMSSLEPEAAVEERQPQPAASLASGA